MVDKEVRSLGGRRAGQTGDSLLYNRGGNKKRGAEREGEVSE
jgi:hypothetical protein